MTGSFLLVLPPTQAQRDRHAKAIDTAGRHFMRTDTIVEQRSSFTLTRASLNSQLEARRAGKGTRQLRPSHVRFSARSSRAKRQNDHTLGMIAQLGRGGAGGVIHVSLHSNKRR